MMGAGPYTPCIWQLYHTLLVAGIVSAMVIAPLAYFVVVIDGNGRVSRRIRKWWYPGIEENGD